MCLQYLVANNLKSRRFSTRLKYIELCIDTKSIHSQRTPRKAGGLRGMAVSKTANGYLEPTVLVDLFLLTDILLDSLQFKTHCRYRITTRPEMLTGEVPYLPTKLTGYRQGTLSLQKPYH
jgi:hypothetical protein